MGWTLAGIVVTFVGTILAGWYDEIYAQFWLMCMLYPRVKTNKRRDEEHWFSPSKWYYPRGWYQWHLNREAEIKKQMEQKEAESGTPYFPTWRVVRGRFIRLSLGGVLIVIGVAFFITAAVQTSQPAKPVTGNHLSVPYTQSATQQNRP